MRLLSSLILLSLSLTSFAQVKYPVIENRGQWPEHVVAQVEIGGGQLYIENQGLTWHFMDLSAIEAVHGTGIQPYDLEDDVRIRGHVYKVDFLGANLSPGVGYEDEQQTKFNYFRGNNPENWQGNVSAHGTCSLQNIYPGIDIKFYNHDLVLKYDVILKPAADVNQIAFKYRGAENVSLVDGRLLVKTSVNSIVEQAPIAWQIKDGENIRVACEYTLENDILGFKFPKGIDPNLETVIDPVLIFSTYSGSTADNFGYTATYDDEGYLYSGSSAFGNGYPTNVGSYQQTWAGGNGQGSLVGTDIAITKYDVTGTFRVYSTYLGGSNDDLPHSLIVNAAGELVVMGTTSSPDFPSTAGAYSSSFFGGTAFAPSGVGTNYVNGSDIIITKFTADGAALAASTFLGGSGNDGTNTAAQLKFNYADEFRGEVEIDALGNIYVASCTFSTNFPVVGGLQSANAGGLDGCIARFSADLSELQFSTYLGGSGNDAAYSLAVAPNGNYYVCGGTTSNNFPTSPDAYQTTFNGGTADGFVVHIDAAGSNIIDATYFGSGAYDQVYFVEVDGDGNPHMYGQTMASGSTMVFNAAYSVPNSGMLVARMIPDLSTLEWSTVFGTGEGEPNMSPTAFLVDVCGKVYLSGWGGSTNTSSNPNTDNLFGMPTTQDAYQTTTNGSDFYLMVLEDDASALVYASFFGGGTSAEHVDGGTSRFNRKGVIYQSVCAGCGSNDDFPIFPPNAVSPTNNSSNCNNGVFKFDFQLPITVADFVVPPVACINQPLQFQNSSNLASSFSWDFGDNTTSTLTNPVHFFSEPGVYAITLYAINPGTCNAQDSLVKFIEIFEPVVQSLGDLNICIGEEVNLGPESPIPGAVYNWEPAELVVSPNSPNTATQPLVDTDFILTVQSGGACVDTLFQSVIVTVIELEVSDDLVLCDGPAIADFQATSPQANAAFTWSSQPDFSDQLNDGPNDGDISIEVNSPTTFYVLASLGGCETTSEVNVSFIAEALSITGNPLVCAGDTIVLNLLTEIPGFDLDWSPDNLIINGDGTESITVVVPDETTFTVFADDNAGCTFSSNITIDVSGLALSDIEAAAEPSLIRDGDESTLTVVPLGYDYVWTPDETLTDPTGQTTIAAPEVTTTYYVEIIDGECVYLDSVEVRVYDFVCGPPMIYVPNAFTPNGDSNNDKVFVHGNFITSLNFVIYNRWGEKVFETNSLNVGWDGTYEGMPVDPAVFVYYLEAICEDGQQHFEKGNITVIR